MKESLSEAFCKYKDAGIAWLKSRHGAIGVLTKWESYDVRGQYQLYFGLHYCRWGWVLRVVNYASGVSNARDYFPILATRASIACAHHDSLH